jgi:hypothetical protein
MDSIEGWLGGKARRVRSSAPPKARKGKKSSPKVGAINRKRKALPASGKLYSFETRIAGIEPPIRRLLVVPGNRSLADLHDILQKAFGRSDSHLHCFRFRGEAFGPPPPDAFVPLAGERNTCLYELALRVRRSRGALLPRGPRQARGGAR